MYIILIGAHGSGKGTRAELLSQELGVRRVGSGELLRKACEERTLLGITAQTYIDRGELVPDELAIAIGGLAHKTLVSDFRRINPKEARSAETDRAGRVKVGSDVTVPGHPNIFVLGNTASCVQDGKPLPGVTQVAIKRGPWLKIRKGEERNNGRQESQ